MLVGLVRWVCRGGRRGAALTAVWGGGILVEGSSRMECILVFFFSFALVLVLVLVALRVCLWCNCSSIVDGLKIRGGEIYVYKDLS